MDGRKKLTIGFVAFLGVITAGLAISTVNVDASDFIFTHSDSSVHVLTMDHSNGYQSGGQNIVYTPSHNPITFTYSNASSSNTGHVILSSNGVINNITQITSIDAFTCTYTGAAGALQFKLSYDNETWGGFTTITSGYTYYLDSNPYYIYIKASSTVTINNISLGYSCVPNQQSEMSHEESTSSEYTLVTSVNQLIVGQRYIVAYSGNTYKTLMTTSRSSKNGKSWLEPENTTFSNNQITGSLSNAAVLTLGGSQDNWTFTNDTYGLLGVTNTSVIAWGSGTTTWTISISNNSATIWSTASSYGRLLFNAQATRYTTYGSGTNLGTQMLLPQLYVEVAGSSETIYDAPEETIIGFTASITKDTFESDEIFDTAAGLSVVANWTGGTTSALSKGGNNGYSYTVKNKSTNATINTAQEFANAGEYLLTVSYKDFIPQTFNLSVSLKKVLMTITPDIDVVNFNTSSILSNFLTDHLTADLTYNISEDNITDLPYANFGEYNLAVSLINPNNVTQSINVAFGTPGTWKIRVYLTSNTSKYGEVNITVNPVPVETVSLQETEASIEEGKTLQLHVAVAPNDATNSNVNWTSSDETIATVSSSGLVTAVKEGTATITATAADGSGKYGSCAVTVTPKQQSADEGEFLLKTDNSFTIGSYVIFASSMYDGSAYALNETQNSNNRGATSVEIDNKTLTRESGSTVKAFRVEEGTTEGTVAFYDETAEGYLYAASSSNNQLKTQDTLNANGSWLVSGSESKTIAAQGNNSRNLLRWNSSSKIFSCYSSGQGAPYIYEKAGDPVYPTAISLSASSHTVGIGQTLTITPTFTPDNTTVKALTWDTTDSNIATVDDGLVTGRAAGTVTISAIGTAQDKSQIVAEYSVTVQTIPVTSIQMNKNSTSLTVGEEDTLTVTFNPSNATNKNVSWETSNNGVATVNNGTVTAVAKGTATITATSEDGNKTATCTVTVSAATTPGETYTILDTDAPATYGSGTKSAASGINFYHNNVMRQSSRVQFKSKGSYLYSTDSLNLQSLTISDPGGSGSITVYGGSSEHPTSNAITGSNNVYNLTGYTYFTIANNSNNAYTTPSITIQVGGTEPTSPTGISGISPSSVSLSPGKTQQLSVIWSNSPNQDMGLTWTSSSTSVATVSSAGLVTVTSTATAGQTATITARSTYNSNYYANCTVTVQQQAAAAHTILIYMCGADLESDSGLASGDITEILNVSGQPENVNIVLETGGASKWSSTHGINKNYLQRYHVENNSLVLDKNVSKVSMGLSSTLQSFVEWGITEYPADRVGLVLWNHGGAMDGVCFDENSNDDPLTNSEVKSAMNGAFNSLGMSSSERLEWIGYDACLMAVQDIAEFNSHYFNYMVCSQETEGGYGWDYDGGWLKDLYKNPTTITTSTLIEKICTTFIADNSSESTLSSLNLMNMSAYLTAWENMAIGLSSIITSSSAWTTFKNVVNSCKKFGYYYKYTSYNGGYVYDVFDAKDLITKMQSNNNYKTALSSQLSALSTAFNNVVIGSHYTSDYSGSHGLNFFCALSGFNSKTCYSTSQTNFTNWRSLNITYGSWYS